MDEGLRLRAVSSQASNQDLAEMIDLDEYLPSHFEETHLSNGKPARVFLSSRTKGRTQARSLGVIVKKMRDWRSLEARTHRLKTAWEASNDSFWESMRSAAPRAKRENEAWFNTGCGLILKYTGDGYTISYVQQTVKDLIESKVKSQQRDFHLVTEDIGREINSLRLRSEKLQKFYGIYRQAFRQAVEERLHCYMHSETSSTKSEFFRRGETLMLRCDERVHPISLTDRFEVVWLSDRVIEVR